MSQAALELERLPALLLADDELDLVLDENGRLAPRVVPVRQTPAPTVAPAPIQRPEGRWD